MLSKHGHGEHHEEQEMQARVQGGCPPSEKRKGMGSPTWGKAKSHQEGMRLYAYGNEEGEKVFIPSLMLKSATQEK